MARFVDQHYIRNMAQQITPSLESFGDSEMNSSTYRGLPCRQEEDPG